MNVYRFPKELSKSQSDKRTKLHLNQNSVNYHLVSNQMQRLIPLEVLFIVLAIEICNTMCLTQLPVLFDNN